MAAVADPIDSVVQYRQTCTVAVTYLNSGRGGNEGALAETIVETLERVGYAASVGPIMGSPWFGEI